MSWTILVIIIAILAMIILALSLRQSKKQPEYPYIKRDALFTAAERSFFGVLQQAVGENALIFGQVRIADVIQTKKGLSRNDWQKYFNKISQKHFDFLLCNKHDLSVLSAIELNDSSHEGKKRIDRDRFLEGACNAANLPLIQIPAQSTYNVNEIQKILAAYLSDVNPVLSLNKPASIIEDQPSDTQKICPKCSSEMTIKVARKGRTVGNNFWGCSAFPKCKYTDTIKV